mmetsp:Transcript_2214/g.6606  ORF Transcript_2214/g.6606 Transcript_2214/m.6606 type:complete len:153 (-) Transcript_2214:487-945(-)|eukprot:CAMPEP_0206148914 /NCGR_PEP_ID=MMETSP1473-20131121/37502_1 /ASSEMBLY_ACC=CAM_ASM_001109 /TAXON_ID=1461547 /ORGANISM="Stichococcus sp, Strain RCC1054" /LENGTH=152 /DNA_ID=CAMNT_0053546347 /DNA_START=920 /DNA_END=1378 /DNA_ORIENTATION=-
MSSGAAPKGDWPPADHLTGKNDPPSWQKPAIIAAVTVGVTLLGVTVVKARTGKTDEDIKEDVQGAADQVKKAGRDVWGLTKDKAGEAKDNLPGTASKLGEDIKHAAQQGGKDLKKGAKVAKNKVQGLYEEEAKPNYGILGWRHVFNNPKYGK